MHSIRGKTIPSATADAASGCDHRPTDDAKLKKSAVNALILGGALVTDSTLCPVESSELNTGLDWEVRGTV